MTSPNSLYCNKLPPPPPPIGLLGYSRSPFLDLFSPEKNETSRYNAPQSHRTSGPLPPGRFPFINLTWCQAPSIMTKGDLTDGVVKAGFSAEVLRSASPLEVLYSAETVFPHKDRAYTRSSGMELQNN